MKYEIQFQGVVIILLFSTLNIANSILSSCRQFIAMKASLRYIIENGDMDDIKNFNKEIGNIRAILITISNVINKVNLRAVEVGSLIS